MHVLQFGVSVEIPKIAWDTNYLILYKQSQIITLWSLVVLSIDQKVVQNQYLG